MGQFDLIPVIDDGLGNSTYLLDAGGGRAPVLDPERDLRQVRAEARRRGLRITWAVETHLNADVVSGVREPTAAEGATVVAPEVGPRGFEATGLSDEDTVELGCFALQALATPGHSLEHLSCRLPEGTRIAGVFTGGSLMVGTAGHTCRCSNRLGWLADPDRAAIIVRDPEQDPEDIVWEAAKVGFGTLTGEWAGGMEAWIRTAPAATIALVEATQVASEADATVLDIRRGPEFAGGPADWAQTAGRHLQVTA